MPEWSLAQVAVAVRSSWSHDTHDPAEEDWRPENPSRGQCGTTALVLHDLLGGEIMLAEVLRLDGSRQGVHYWNRLPGGEEVDLTREQFAADEIVQVGRVVERPPGLPRRCAEQYVLLRERTMRALAAERPPAAAPL